MWYNFSCSLNTLWTKHNVVRDPFDNYLLVSVKAIFKFSHEGHLM